MAIKKYVGDKVTGLSTDAKPTNMTEGATFIELDTEKMYVYTSSTWNEIRPDTDIDHNSLTNTHDLTTDIDHNTITNGHNLTTDIDHIAIKNGHNLTTDIDHNSLTNTHNLTTDIDHNSLTNYSSNEHIDWTDTSENLNTSGTITSETITIGNVTLEYNSTEDSLDFTFI